MPSSISSSSPRLPQASAWLALLAAVIGALLVLVGGESVLAWRGFVATAVDSEELWVSERALVAADPRATVILGSSRAQVDVEPDVVAAATGRRAVQLAIDNTSFVPVLAGLAEDPDFAGIVIVDFLERFAVPGQRDSMARAWQSAYARRTHLSGYSPSSASEAWLSAALRSRMRLYADGAQALTNLLTRGFDSAPGAQYLVILPNRSRLADYTRLPMPHFYYRTVARYLETSIEALPWSQGLAAVEAELKAQIEALPLPDAAAIDAGIVAVSELARQIETRGGRVYFVRLPSCGLILDAERRLYPRDRYWSALERANPGRTLHFADYPELSVDCPDGSHLDRSEVRPFTAALMRIMLAKVAEDR